MVIETAAERERWGLVGEEDGEATLPTAVESDEDEEWLQSAVAAKLGLGSPSQWCSEDPIPMPPGGSTGGRSRTGHSLDTDQPTAAADQPTAAGLVPRPPRRSSVRHLKRRAREEGFSEQAIEAAEDEPDPHAAFEALLRAPPS